MKLVGTILTNKKESLDSLSARRYPGSSFVPRAPDELWRIDWHPG